MHMNIILEDLEEKNIEIVLFPGGMDNRVIPKASDDNDKMCIVKNSYSLFFLEKIQLYLIL